MKKNDYTKERLAQALKQLSRTRTLKSVSVQSIADACGINRGTFYYHFYDKQELINWIYHSDITEPTQKFLSESPENWTQISRFGLNLMFQEKDFYIQAVKLDGQNNLSDYIKTEIEGNWNILVNRYTELCNSAAVPTDMSFFANFMAGGAYSMLMKWLENGMQESPSMLAELIDTIAAHSLDAFVSQNRRS